jgi:methionyl-tRNA formyltransferase
MLPKVVWEMPKRHFNLHASLLPNYRGAAPITNINGETKTGVSTFSLMTN